MCDPVSIGVALGATALSAGGQMLNQSEEDKNNKRMMEAAQSQAEAERIRQGAFQQQSADLFDSSLAGQSADSQVKKLDTEQAKRSADTAANINVNTEYNPPSQSAPSVVNSEIGRKMADAISKATTNAQNLGTLNAWQNLGTQNKIDMANTNAKMGTVSNFSRGSLNLLPLEQSVAAQNARKAKSGIGDWLQLGGTALGLAGSTGAVGPGGGLWNTTEMADNVAGPRQLGWLQRW